MTGTHKIKYIVAKGSSFVDAANSDLVANPTAAWQPFVFTAPQVWQPGDQNWVILNNVATGQLKTLRGTSSAIGQCFNLEASLVVRAGNEGDSMDLEFAFFHNGVLVPDSTTGVKIQPGDTWENASLLGTIPSANVNDVFELRYRGTYNFDHWLGLIYATFRAYMD